MRPSPGRGNPAYRAPQAHPAADDMEDQEFPEWFSALVWWPISFLGLCLRLIGRFSKLAFLITISALTYQWFYAWLIPPSLSESHHMNFLYPEETAARGGGVPANATVDFAPDEKEVETSRFQRQLMVRAGARGMDWSSSSSAGSSLDIGVTLLVPESSANFEVGPFMVNATVFDKQGVSVGNGTRSLVAQHKSALLQGLTTAFFALPMLLGFGAEQQRLSGTVIQLVQLPKQGLHSATVSISDSRLQVYQATIDIKFVLVGFRYYMYHWYLSTLCLGTAVFCNLYLQLLRWAARQLFGDEALAVDDEIAEATQAVQQRGQAARRGRRRRSDRVRPRASPRMSPGKASAEGGLPGGPSAMSPRTQHSSETEDDEQPDLSDAPLDADYPDDDADADADGVAEDSGEGQEAGAGAEEEEWVEEELATSDGSVHTPRATAPPRPAGAQAKRGRAGTALAVNEEALRNAARQALRRRHGPAVMGPAGSDNPA